MRGSDVKGPREVRLLILKGCSLGSDWDFSEVTNVASQTDNWYLQRHRLLWYLHRCR